MLATLGLRDKAVHLAAVEVGGCIRAAMRATASAVGGIMVRADAATIGRIRNAHRELPALTREAVGAWIGAEVLLESPLLLHDHDHVLDLVDSVRGFNRRRRGLIRGVGRPAARDDDEHEGSSNCAPIHAYKA